MDELWSRITDELLVAGSAPTTATDVYRFVRLHALASAVSASGRTPEYLACLRPHLDLGNGILLRRPSIGVCEFFEENVLGWYSDKPESLALATAYCMAHSHAPEVFTGFTDKTKFYKSVKAFSRNIPVSNSELSNVLESFSTLADDVEQDIQIEQENGKNRSDNGWMIEMICHDYSMAPRDVIWTVSRSEVKFLVDNGLERKRLEAMKKSGKYTRMNPHSRKGAALKAFYTLRDEISAQTGKPI